MKDAIDVAIDSAKMGMRSQVDRQDRRWLADFPACQDPRQ